MHDGVEGKSKGPKLLFLPLLKRASDLAAFAMMDMPPKTVMQFCMVELGQNAPPERRIVDVVKDVDCLGDPADFGKRARRFCCILVLLVWLGTSRSMTRRRRAARVRQDQAFKGRQFTAEVMLWAVRWYLMFPIS